jgi:hypothetical protein
MAVRFTLTWKTTGAKRNTYIIKFLTVHEAATAYKMNVDAFNYEGNIEELLSYYNNMKFSTYDRENDLDSRNCVSWVDGLVGGIRIVGD